MAAESFLDDGLKMLNFARYLAGLPDDVELDAARNEQAQHGAVLMGASEFSHFPPRPADMPQAFYDIGYASTSSSNIGSGYRDLQAFVADCLCDHHLPTNIESLGHRRWLLNPPMKLTGMGYAGSGFWGGAYTTTYAFDRSRQERVEYSTITWPSAGAFPVEMFRDVTPWSITLNPDRYDIDRQGPHAVTLRRVSDDTTWTFDATDTNKTGDFFNTDFRGFGIPNVFVFRPDPRSVDYKPGDVFEVVLSGGIFSKGTTVPETISYRTEFVSMLVPEDVPIVVTGDDYEVFEGTELIVAAPGVLDNDFCADGMPLTAHLVDDAANGKLFLSEDGGFAYTPDDGFTGIDAFTYRAHNSGDYSAVATVTISVSELPTYTITASSGSGGTIAPAGSIVVDHGASQIFTLEPDEGYRVHEVRVNGRAAQLTGTTLTLARVVADSIIEVRFEPVHGPVKPLPQIISGNNRYLTAIKGSQTAFPNGSSAVVIATGENFADALGGAGLAGALDGPLLLTQKASLPGPVMTEVGRLNAKKAYILGGTGAVSAQVEASLKTKLGTNNVIRLQGSNRYQTADRVAAETIRVLNTSGTYTGDAFVATGANFPDALGASPIAAAQGMPVFLADPTRSTVPLPASVKRVWITGGTAAVSAPTETSLKRSLGTANVKRLAGGNRFDTAARVAAFGVGRGMSWEGVGITTGMNFPDALAAGPALGSRGAVMLLTDTNAVPQHTSTALSANKTKISRVTFFGGDAAVPPGVRTTVNNLTR